MADLNAMRPAELRAAMKGGTEGWGKVGSAARHVRYMVVLPKIKARRQCSCGCEGKATHVGAVNGLVLLRGCELSMMRWVKTGSHKRAAAPDNPKANP